MGKFFHECEIFPMMDTTPVIDGDIYEKGKKRTLAMSLS